MRRRSEQIDKDGDVIVEVRTLLPANKAAWSVAVDTEVKMVNTESQAVALVQRLAAQRDCAAWLIDPETDEPRRLY
jgi:ribonuclease D